jgi:hypothetical protein
VEAADSSAALVINDEPGAAVWLLWRSASSGFFKPQDFTQAGSGTRQSSRIQSSGHGCRVVAADPP